MKISAAIITLNEEKDLARCFRSIKNLADEIIVVDSGSIDKTVKIAMEFGAKVFERKFDNYASQRNFAASKAKGDWILSIDADEEITPELSDEIKTKIQGNRFDAYSMPRRNIIFGKLIKYTRWQPELDRHIWLWKRGSGKWIGEVHEEFAVYGQVGKLKNFKTHHQYKTVAEFLEMMNKYSSLDKNPQNPVYHFLVRYFYRLGFLDGWRGFVLSYLMAIYQLEIWVKSWEQK